MFKRSLFSLTAVIAVVAIFLSNRSSKPAIRLKATNWPGRNNTALFLSNSEHGLANVLLATSHALLIDYPDIEIHFASFPKLARNIEKIKKFGSNAAAQSSSEEAQTPIAAKPITFHPFAGHSYSVALKAQGFEMDNAIQPPGIKGLEQFLRNMQDFMMPWSGPEYLGLYHEAILLIEEIDPLVVAVDPLFGPGLDAIRALGRNHVIISPNSLKDNFAAEQPWGAFLWKYPAMSSGYPYPVPLHLIPSNIYLILRFIYSIFVTPALTAKKTFLKDHGIAKPLDIFSVYQPDSLWLSQSLPSIDFPVSIIPESVVPCGPIYLSVASAEAQDPELAEWMKRAPTVMINLGSNVNYDEVGAREMARAVKRLLDKAQVQVLWKFNKRREFGDEFLEQLQGERILGRLRLETWLSIDPASLMESGNVAVSVHHGGANCYHEAVGTGIPQLVLPLWVDLYEYATRVEYLGIGIWGNKRTAPDWTVDELGDALLMMVGNGEEAVEMRRKAKELATVSKMGGEGRVRAAGEVARLARRV